MVSLEKRIHLADTLGKYILSNDNEWEDVKHRAVSANPWFTLGNIDLAVKNIAQQFLQKSKLEEWVKKYQLPSDYKTVGIIMAGNIPLVGFHDFICGFISCHKLMIKLSSKDDVLLRHLIAKLIEWEPTLSKEITIAEILKGCDAYIATGSNNTARYFEQYFSKYANIIRKNRTSIAILDGSETTEELSKLADDIFTYFGLGCRNVTQVCVPVNYDFSILLEACDKYHDLILHHKYKHNFDYYLAIYLLNKVPCLTNDAMLLVENSVPFSAVSVVHYRYYDNIKSLENELENNNDVQCIVGHGHLPFGSTQSPSLKDYADNEDTMQFLCSL